MSGASGLVLRRITIDLGTRRLIDLDLAIPPGQAVTLMGPSGAGKSTLLAWITGQLPPAFTASGEVELNGRNMTRAAPQDRRIGILFQDDLLFPHLSVGGNLLFALPREVRGRRARRTMAAEALAEAGLDGFIDRDPATLSGGQRARVALIRTLLSRPSALLLDEPFSKLDAALRRQIRRFVFDRIAAAGLPTLMVTHDRDDAAAAGGPVIEV